MCCYRAEHEQHSTKCPRAHQTKGAQDLIRALSTLKEQALNVLFIKMIVSKEGTEGSMFFKMQNSEKVWTASSTIHININIHILIKQRLVNKVGYLQSKMQGCFV